jgi:hypothetical protein
MRTSIVFAVFTIARASAISAQNNPNHAVTVKGWVLDPFAHTPME